MSKKVLASFTILYLLYTVFLTAFKISVKASPGIIYVPTVHPTIQEAINAANSGDTVYVYNGIYYENVVVNKTVRLLGESRDKTVLNGKGLGDVISIQEVNVTVSGFTVRGNSGICVRVERTPTNILVRDNIIQSNRIGIDLVSEFYGLPFISGIAIEDNVIKNNSIGIHLGGIDFCSIVKNIVANNTDYGILLEINPYQTPEMRGSHMNVISFNSITNNSIGIGLIGRNNSIYHNNLIDNSEQISILSKLHSYPNKWDNGYPYGGNYWSDYNGADYYYGLYQNKTGSDGIGDTPYHIDENNQDSYPLTHPYSPFEIRVLYYDLMEKFNELLSRHNSLNQTCSELSDNLTDLQEQNNSLNSTLTSGQEDLISQLNNVRNLMYIFIATTIILITTTVYLAIRKPKIKP